MRRSEEPNSTEFNGCNISKITKLLCTVDGWPEEVGGDQSTSSERLFLVSRRLASLELTSILGVCRTVSTSGLVGAEGVAGDSPRMPASVKSSNAAMSSWTGLYWISSLPERERKDLWTNKFRTQKLNHARQCYSQLRILQTSTHQIIVMPRNGHEVQAVAWSIDCTWNYYLPFLLKPPLLDCLKLFFSSMAIYSIVSL